MVEIEGREVTAVLAVW